MEDFPGGSDLDGARSDAPGADDGVDVDGAGVLDGVGVCPAGELGTPDVPVLTAP